MNKGFTLVETIIVVALVSVLLGGMILALNPLQKLASARDNTRQSHLYQIWEAVTKKQSLEGRWQCGNQGFLPHDVDQDNKPIFKYIGTGSGNYDLFSCLIPDYLPKTLMDPKQGSEQNTGYQIWQHPVTKKISLYAPYAETKTISIGVKPNETIPPMTDFFHGWAFSENIGWISMSSYTGGGEKEYGIVLNSNGNLMGFAWSSGTDLLVGGLGWLKFDPPGPYPSSPSYSAKYDPQTGKITGWARFCSGTVNNDCNSNTRSDFDGWVLLGPINIGGTDYGVRVDTSVYPAQLYGWAYGSEPIGWISFNCNNQELPSPRCERSDYKVFMEKKSP